MKVRLLLSVLMAVCLFPTMAHADARSELQTIYNGLLQAYKKQDFAHFMKYQAADFKMKLPDGKVINKQQANADMKRGMEMRAKMKNAPMPKIGLRVQSVVPKGNTAVATVATTASMSRKDPQGKSHTFSSMSTERHTWVKSPQGWKVRLIEPLKSTALMDGKPINMPTMPAPKR